MAPEKKKEMKKPPDDPIEKIIFEALTDGGVIFTVEGDEAHPDHRLDFHLTDFDVAIECKWRHSERISDQMSRKRDVIAIQGPKAAYFFADMMKLGM